MKIVDLKLDGARDEFYGPAPDYGVPDYPWGARISLTNEQLAALGWTTFPPVGSMFTIAGTGRVVSFSEDESNEADEPYRRMELQIMQLGLDPQMENGAAKLYNSTSDGQEKG